MTARNLIFAICLLLFTSCVVKSLHPFYTKESISFDKNFIGKWEDSKKGKWNVVAFTDKIIKDDSKMKKDDWKLYLDYKNSYFIKRGYKNKEVIFIATPFVINNQKFLDFFPINQESGIDNLLESHSVYTHSLVKYDVQKNGEIEIRWLDEDKIEALFKEKKIKIKHEKIGLTDDKYLLTAKPEELQKFVKKYMASNDAKKWETSTKFTLSKINVTD
ncbi:hypothetical protein JL193_09855 [Polaribacter batillariae]|uniref:Lipoprotein n=1 Tax=Polaribacter batillariae TaxID=2808900 RepID=A0ABX7SQF8_9FLAO|nr:hypothetical protein [Polaribacter batillariae]QTD36459.1 hypothetical protein JL193_09855 [Polaribacter batillariae]